MPRIIRQAILHRLDHMRQSIQSDHIRCPVGRAFRPPDKRAGQRINQIKTQAKLLRVIQERKVRPLGATKEEPVDVRIVSATHYDLAAAVQGKSFRQDLYYRLNVIELILPPLRERRSDIPAIAQVLLAKIAADSGLPLRPLSPQAQATLQVLPLAGNVRELENILQRALAMSEGELLEIDAPGLDEAALRAIEKEAVKAGFSAQNAKNILKNAFSASFALYCVHLALPSPSKIPASLAALPACI